MAQLRHGLRAYALDGLEPAEIANRLDALIYSPFLENLATLVYAAITPERTLKYVNAGHLPPLVVDADGKTRLLEHQSGLPIGCRHPSGYRAHVTELAPGETLILYSDGLVERRGESIDDGIDRLRRIAAHAPPDPQELADHVLRALLPGAGGEDDIALLAVRPEPVPASTG
jgi:serine phosphatase RsbU (regulator of sigma subunit)